jgi:hypothetical protein
MSELFTEVPDKQRSMRASTWARRAAIAAFAIYAAAALLDAVGQGTTTTTAAGPSATMRVDAPERLRGGLLFQTRIDVRARAGIERPRLVFSPGVFEGMQVSSIEPQPMSESSRNGRVELSYPAIIAGERLRVWLQFQVAPNSPGERRYRVELDEGTTPLAVADRSLRVLP